MKNKLYYTALEVKEFLGVSKSEAYILIRQMNAELKDQGYLVLAGRIPRKYFENKVYGLLDLEVKENNR